MTKKSLSSLGVISVVASVALLFGGCSNKVKIEPSSVVDTNLSVALQEKDTKIQEVAKENIQKDVKGTFYQTSIFSAVKSLADQAEIQVDQSFIPSEKYRVSLDVDGSLKDFLAYAKQTTSVDYRYRNGKLVVVNRDLVDQSIAGKQCSVGSQATVTMSFKDVSPNQVFKYFSDNYGMTFVYKTKYTDLSDGGQMMGGGSLPKAAPVSLQYSGCDQKEALRVFLSANNLIAEEVTPGSFNIMDFEVATIDVPVYFDYKFTSSSGVGGSSSGGSLSGGGDSASGGDVSTSESPKKDLTEYLQKFIGQKGKVSVSSRGFVTIEDTPENVRTAKRLIMKEIAKQRPIELQVSVFRIDINDGLKTGVDWDMVMGEWSDGLGLGIKNIGFNASYASGFSGGGAFSVNNAERTQLIRLLETFGDTRIVREFRTKAKSGILNTFKAVEQIPYVTTTTTSSSAGFSSNVEAKVAEAGLIINVMPSLDKNGETVDLSTNIIVSEYLGDKTFQMSTGTFTLPRISTNEVKIPGKVNIGQTMVLTGFKIAKDSKTKEGVPGLIHIPFLGGLAGSDIKDSSESEFIIVITPKEIEEV